MLRCEIKKYKIHCDKLLNQSHNELYLNDFILHLPFTLLSLGLQILTDEAFRISCLLWFGSLCLDNQPYDTNLTRRGWWKWKYNFPFFHLAISLFFVSRKAKTNHNELKGKSEWILKDEINIRRRPWTKT